MTRRAMRFEKWQALGNDYLIVERDRAAVRAHRRRASARLCDPHFGVGADGVLELSPPDEPGFVARLRIFNPDGSEAELSGNGAREAILYLRRARLDRRRDVLDPDRRRRDPPDDPRTTTCRVDMGRARLRRRTSRRAADGTGVEAGGATGASSTSRSATRSARSASPTATTLEALDLPAIGPPIEHDAAVPEPHERLVLDASSRPDAHPRADLRARRGGDAVLRHRRRGAAVAHVLRGGDSPVTVALDGGELEVDVGEDLHVDLTGWAVPVYAGELSAELRGRAERS